ncbi:hypothetical protein QA641_31245 [Bradyrhizobium sp. CB1650]|uniref:hypothetical protein n=1 Tax=Bradyrhizobium sp. CB1650 TaxID=3039153 RepID=UPI0024358547|nr:hypothetical protein [Bradyrhizobium sp. CB1650]WGD50077.1 hypothetical protein QA641_31245 [Bradyrhizobium sp. CB1650]
MLARERTVGVEVSRTDSRRQNNDRVRLSVQFVMFARRDSAIARMQRQIEDDQCEKKKQTEKMWTGVKDRSPHHAELHQRSRNLTNARFASGLIIDMLMATRIVF